ncbi:Ku protein [Streptacidiphilus sp. P02-A3a]|uniref:non-homologous end joining protein Ku n=1 Tax=Streptacidiphilus sp. P02-A3a TaxID=2704468 RepID=UPI0015FDCD74|nr:Ku protein [Streptacidiphilus sp. P02-A3a]QMU70718.1 Ku protein [Streptacidiphilus sp. P02-A3a]
MARPIWTGALSFGLVTVPVSLYSATEDHTTHFRQIQRGTSDRVRIRRVNERTGEEVAFGDIVKGYDLGDHQYVVIDPGELDEIAPGRSHVIAVSAFVDLSAVDPVYFSGSYYLAPRGEEFARIYALLLEALEESGRAAVASFVMRGKEYLTAIRPAGEVLQLHTLHYADEVRDPRQELPGLPDRAGVDPQQLTAARQLIDALSAEWNPEEYRDSFEDRVRELIDAKRAGNEITSAETAPEATNVIDLMAALRRSLDRAEGRPDAAEAAEPAPEQPEQPERPDPQAPRAGDGGGKVSRLPENLSGLSKAELYARATAQGIPGRSKMTRDQLREALTGASRKRGRRSSVA